MSLTLNQSGQQSPSSTTADNRYYLILTDGASGAFYQLELQELHLQFII